MKFIAAIHRVAYVAAAVVFIACAFIILAFGVIEMLQSLRPGNAALLEQRFRSVLECIGLITVSVACVGLSQTILEEEVVSHPQVSASTRVRRFLSRFLVVVVVALAIEFLVAVFEFLHGDPGRLPHAAAVGGATAMLLVGWGVFVRLSAAAERQEQVTQPAQTTANVPCGQPPSAS